LAWGRGKVRATAQGTSAGICSSVYGARNSKGLPGQGRGRAMALCSSTLLAGP